MVRVVRVELTKSPRPKRGGMTASLHPQKLVSPGGLEPPSLDLGDRVPLQSASASMARTKGIEPSNTASTVRPRRQLGPCAMVGAHGLEP